MLHRVERLDRRLVGRLLRLHGLLIDIGDLQIALGGLVIDRRLRLPLGFARRRLALWLSLAGRLFSLVWRRRLAGLVPWRRRDRRLGGSRGLGDGALVRYPVA